MWRMGCPQEWVISIFIRKDDFINFPYEPKLFLESKVICFEGKVEDYNGTPTINVEGEDQLEILPN